MTTAGPKVVVADAGPLIGLSRTGRLPLLHRLFLSVMVPPAVAAELRLSDSRPGSLALARAREEGWLAVVPVAAAPPHLARLLDAGEAEAIALAKAQGALLLIDERAGRTAATKEGVAVVGTGAVLIRGKQEGWLTAVLPEIEALRQAGYRISASIRAEILRLAGES